MKRLMALFCVLSVAAWADVPAFWHQLTLEERRAAGIDQLSPEQQAALDKLAQRFSSEGARQQLEAVKAEARKEADEAVEKTRAEAREDERRKKIAGAGLAARDDDEVIHTRILGRFYGWDGRTNFKLENGQVWQQANPDLKYFPNLVDPEVELIPSSWAGWKLKIVSEGVWCKVKRIQ
jgi:hypothetical protein